MTSVATSAFLPDAHAKRWRPGQSVPGLEAQEFFVGRGSGALEVAWATASARPTFEGVRKLWRTRQGGRASPVLLVVVFPATGGERAFVCGPAGDVPPVHGDFDLDRVERLCLAALDEPDRHSALRLVTGLLPDIGSSVPGLRNTGLLATHELVADVPTRHDWTAASRIARPLLNKQGRALVEALGFGIDAMGAGASLLSLAGHPRAAAVFLDEDEAFDLPAARLDNTTAVTHALRMADERGVPWVITTRGHQIRLYAARPDTGVGRKGRSETFVELNLAVLDPDDAGYLELLFSGRALSAEGTIEELLEQSENFAADLGSRLRDRVYQEVVPPLATAVASRMQSQVANLDEEDLADAYEQTLTILFRLLFVAYAEDKGLLPYGTHGRYQDHALKTIARHLTDAIRAGSLDFDEHATDLWDDLKNLWHAIDQGNRNWGVPQYNGGLFSDESDVNPVGSRLSDLELTNAEIGPPLAALLVDTDDDVIGPVDFRTLSVRDFGTIYEGLLESGLSIATGDLAVDANGTYVPATVEGEIVEVEEGEIYFHNRSGARKATGSYFTKAFAVEHLLDYALEPAIIRHLEHVSELADSGKEAAAADLLFDFRCVDLAMGSGHFLVAAVDRIEARFSTFLATRPNWPAMVELERLRTKALDELNRLGDNFAAGTEIETSSLLRRQIARRCIYGIDRTSIAVELARLSLWVHTFVPGLPLSFLNHGLRRGNSLTGIGTVDEAVDAVDPEGDGKDRSLFAQPLLDALERARPALKKLGALSDIDRIDIAQARSSQRDAEEIVVPVERLFDQIVGARLDEIDMPTDLSPSSLGSARRIARANAVARDVEAFHFPTAFPEVFLRDRPGFDCILGNPPWDKVLFQPQAFWVTRSPGLNALPAAKRPAAIEQLRLARPGEASIEERERAVRERLQTLIEIAYPNRGRGHYDFAKLFVERACALSRESGLLGYVLPANSLLLGGWSKLRELLLEGSDLTILQARNKGGWFFDDVDNRYTIVLLTRSPAESTESIVSIWPGIRDVEQLRGARRDTSLRLPEAVLKTLSDSAVIPWLNNAPDSRVFEQMRSYPNLAGAGGWVDGRHDARWDFRSSGPDHRFSSTRDEPGSWRVLMTRHVCAFGIDDGRAWQQFVQDPLGLGNGIETEKNGMPVLGRDHPLVIFRHPSRNDDSRTMVATALPAGGYLHNKGYVHAIRHATGTEPDVLLALLGYMNTFTCDWWVRRFVDRHISAPVVNNLRLPDWSKSDIRHAARLSRGLLWANGARELAGGLKLTVSPAGLDTTDAVTQLEHLAAAGFGLTVYDMELILDDFSTGEAACPPDLRSRILEGMT
jgi:hypothetical protein